MSDAKTNPLVSVAAVAVIALSGVGVAKMMNWLPGSAPVAATSTSAAGSSTQAGTAASTPTTPAARPATVHHEHSAPRQVATADNCSHCGVVTSVNKVVSPGHGSGLGAIAGALVGGVVGNQFGGGNGKIATTAAGAIGGGVVGNLIEDKERSTTTWQVHVRFNSGNSQTFSYGQDPQISVGTPVRESGGELYPR